MAIFIVTDNYFYMQGIRDVADDIYYVSDGAKKNNIFYNISSDDWVVLNLSALEDMFYFYQFFRLRSEARIVISLDLKFTSVLSEINNVFFLSADASLKDATEFFYGRKPVVRKRSLTRKEEIVMLLMLHGQDLKSISEMLGLSIKTISLHKNHINDKAGLIAGNYIALLSVMKFILAEINASALRSSLVLPDPSVDISGREFFKYEMNHIVKSALIAKKLVRGHSLTETQKVIKPSIPCDLLNDSSSEDTYKTISCQHCDKSRIKSISSVRQSEIVINNVNSRRKDKDRRGELPFLQKISAYFSRRPK